MSNQQPAVPSDQSSSSAPSTAQTGAATTPVSDIQPKTENGITYACGGIGVDEAEKMKTAAKDYDAMLTFAARDAGFLADVNVTITDNKGNDILHTFCGAPMLLVKDFPHPGVYHVRAETGGYTLDKKINIKKKPKMVASVVLLWPEQLAEAVTPQEDSVGSSGAAGTSGAGSDADTGAGINSGNQNPENQNPASVEKPDRNVGE
jgi:hypothetical protein